MKTIVDKGWKEGEERGRKGEKRSGPASRDPFGRLIMISSTSVIRPIHSVVSAWDLHKLSANRDHDKRERRPPLAFKRKAGYR